MSVESKGLHAQNCFCRNLACLCTVMEIADLDEMLFVFTLLYSNTSSSKFRYPFGKIILKNANMEPSCLR